MADSNHSSGFTLIEVIVAVALLATAAAGVASLVSLALRSTRTARDETAATFLAVDKLEELRRLHATGAGVGAAPAGALRENVPGFVDFLDRSGRPSTEAVFARRWSAQPLPSDPGRSVVLQVVVMPVVLARVTPRPGLLPGAVLLTTVHTRQGS